MQPMQYEYSCSRIAPSGFSPQIGIIQYNEKEEIDMKVHYMILVASMIAAAPLLAADKTPEKGDRNRYSDRDMRKNYQDEEKSSSRC
jgi:hypothetical protein